MRKIIFSITLMVIVVVVNFSVIISEKSSFTSLSNLTLDINVAFASEAGVKACLTASAWAGDYVAVDANYQCTNEDGEVCGEEQECDQVPWVTSGCTQLCCK